jgi:hypothetical protein
MMKKYSMTEEQAVLLERLIEAMETGVALRSKKARQK